MTPRMALRVVTLAGAIGLSTVACTITSTEYTSDASTRYRSPAATDTLAARECADRGGVYFDGGNYCEVGSGLTWRP